MDIFCHSLPISLRQIITLKIKDMNKVAHKMIKLIYSDQQVTIYQHSTTGGTINVYHLKNGELMFGSKKVSVLNRFERTKAYMHICKSLNTNR